MRRVNFVVALAIASLYCMTSFAQTNPPHLFHVNTQYMVPGLDDAGRAERDAMLKEYGEKVTKKNQYILHQWVMVHYYSEDSREFVTIHEYATWADIDKANERSDELEKAAWPDEQKRNAFTKKMSSYFSSHKDAIYHEMPMMGK